MSKTNDKQKKLMILGGSRYALPVIEAAHKLGIYVITCDYLPDNYAHRFSDEYCNVSIIDKEATLEAAKRLKIDGIVSFACDPGVVTAAYVAEKMGLPNVGPYESVCILQNKGRFRRFLAEHGFTVPTARQYVRGDEADPSLFHWPVIVKPTDSAGSKGVTRVDRPEDLPAAVSHALDFSHCDEFIVEDFITQKGFSSDTDCFSVDGELRFVSFNNQRFDPDCENPYAPAGFSWPSSMSEEHQEELKNELQRLLRLLGMRTALYNIECREGTDGKAYLMEVSPRGGGNRLAECLRHATGVDLIEAVVRDAVGLPLDDVAQKPYRGHFAEVILHSEKPGIFESLETDPSLAENIVERDLWVEPGDAVGGFSAANESLGTLILRFDSEERLAEVMQNVRKYVHVNVK
ncbi:MAG: ATP-grasp domain-containing protein [Lachnospiraceae bacterium]|nr:ATP-grasp domain-containing protein [Lachnospiraceae bacterium]